MGPIVGDSHPSDAGYRALAGVAFDASAYIRLLQSAPCLNASEMIEHYGHW